MKALDTLIPDFELNKELHELGFRCPDELVVWWWVFDKKKHSLIDNEDMWIAERAEVPVSNIIPAYHIGIGLVAIQDIVDNGEMNLPLVSSPNDAIEILIAYIKHSEKINVDWRAKWLTGRTVEG
jgi:hypothetical protein